MWLWIALGLAVLVGLARPFGSRLQATSLWAGKALVPPQAASANPRGLQSAINAGWPSWVGLLTGLGPFIVAAVGFLYSWWAPILVFSAVLLVSVVAERTPIASGTVDRYLMLLLQHAQRRRADFAKKGDEARADAAKALEDEIQRLAELYVGSGVPAPTVDQAKKAPFGYECFLFKLHRAGEL